MNVGAISGASTAKSAEKVGQQVTRIFSVDDGLKDKLNKVNVVGKVHIAQGFVNIETQFGFLKFLSSSNKFKEGESVTLENSSQDPSVLQVKIKAITPEKPTEVKIDVELVQYDDVENFAQFRFPSFGAMQEQKMLNLHRAAVVAKMNVGSDATLNNGALQLLATVERNTSKFTTLLPNVSSDAFARDLAEYISLFIGNKTEKARLQAPAFLEEVSRYRFLSLNLSTDRWHVLLIPVMNGSEQVLVKFMFKDDKESPDSRRFLVEIDLKDGKYIIDGLLKNSEKPNLWIVVKSEGILDKELEVRINKIFDESKGLYGFEGNVSFQRISKMSSVFTELIHEYIEGKFKSCTA